VRLVERDVRLNKLEFGEQPCWAQLSDLEAIGFEIFSRTPSLRTVCKGGETFVEGYLQSQIVQTREDLAEAAGGGVHMEHDYRENRIENFDEDSDIRAESRKLSGQRPDYSLHFSATQSAPAQRGPKRLLRNSLSCGTRAFGVSQLRLLARHCFVTRLRRARHSNFTESPASPSHGAGVCNDEDQFSIRSNQARLNSHDYTRFCHRHHRHSGLLWLGGRVCRIASSPPMRTGVLYCLKLPSASPLT
jgi:hypothetical protein